MSPSCFLADHDFNAHGIIENLLLIWSASEAEEWNNQVCFLSLS